MYNLPPPVTSDPSVPPEQVLLLAQRELALLPEDPNCTGGVSACWLREFTLNCTEADADDFACETAVTVTTAGSVLCIVATVGTVFGAVYKPVAEIEPQTLVVLAVAVAVHVTPQVTA